MKLLLVALLSCTFVACQKSDRPPAAASSAESVAYAKHYPAELEALSARYDREVSAANENFAKFSSYPEALNDPPWDVVEATYSSADEEGRGQAYAARREQEEVVLAFHAAERKELVSKIAGATQHAAKQQGHELKLYGPTDWALERGINERLEERRRGVSDAHTRLAEREKALGKQNFDALSQQADEIMLAAHVAHVAAAEREYALRQLVGQASDAKSSLERRHKELLEAPDGDKEQIQEIETAVAQIDPAVTKANQQLETAKQRHEDLKKAYDEAFDGLMDLVKTRKREAGASKTAP